MKKSTGKAGMSRAQSKMRLPVAPPVIRFSSVDDYQRSKEKSAIRKMLTSDEATA
jgi:hypothetical protein